MSCREESAIVPRVEVQFTDIYAEALLDSGATISLINKKLFDEIKEFTKINYISRQVSIVSFTQQPVKYNNCVEVNFKINEKNFKQVLFVTPEMESAQYKLILGMDFFRKNKAILDLLLLKSFCFKISLAATFHL